MSKYIRFPSIEGNRLVQLFDTSKTEMLTLTVSEAKKLLKEEIALNTSALSAACEIEAFTAIRRAAARELKRAA